MPGFEYPYPAGHFFAAQPIVRPVVNEYKWKDQAPAGLDNSATFTVALKDGSRRSAVATWVQKSKLYYVDSTGRQDAVASELIDRDTTQRLNGQSKLYMQLPPVSH